MAAGDPIFTPLGYEQVTSLSAAAALTPASGAQRAVIQAESQNVRWRDDGTNPTTTVGNILLAGDSMLYQGDLDTIRFIETLASAKLNVHYY